MKKPSFKKPNFEKIDEAIANIKSAFQNASQTNRQIINFKRVIANWEKGLKRLLPLGGFSGGNDVKLFFDGDALFADYKKSIDAAEKSVWVEVYILESDEIGIYIRNALIEAAKRGCEVILIFDYLGSRGLSNSFLRPLKESGAKVHVFNPIWPWRKKGPLIRRDHRKVLIVDEKIGYCGGMNISREYAGKKLGSGRYVDAQIRVLGPAVKDLSNLFLDTYSETSGELRHNFETYYKHARNNIVPSERVFLQVLASNSRRNLRAIQSSMKEALERATSYCYLTTPYFMPFGPLRKAMIDAAKRGVDVRVLTAGLSDLPMAQLAGQYI